MGDHHGQEEVGIDIEAEKLGNLVGAAGNLRLLIENQLVNYLSQDFLGVGLDSCFNTDDQRVELAQTFLLEMGLEGKLIHVLEHAVHQLLGVPADNVPGTLARAL